MTVALTWVAPDRNISGYPSEPSSQSTFGLHLLHYDAWDKHGNRADRKSRLVRVVQPTDEEEDGLAGCRCLRMADITKAPGAGAFQGTCSEGTFTYALDLKPGHPQDISCCEAPQPALALPVSNSLALTVQYCNSLGSLEEVMRLQLLVATGDLVSLTGPRALSSRPPLENCRPQQLRGILCCVGTSAATHLRLPLHGRHDCSGSRPAPLPRIMVLCQRDHVQQS